MFAIDRSVMLFKFFIISTFIALFVGIEKPTPTIAQPLEPEITISVAAMDYLEPVTSAAKIHLPRATDQDIEAVECLALNAYFEARNSSRDDMIAVSSVVVNRMRSSRYPDTICDVVWQYKQFSWTHDGKSDRPNLTHPAEARAWQQAMAVAIGVYIGWYNDTTSGATHYHAYYVNPYWAPVSLEKIRIGKHYYMATI